ncbi:IS66 family transposase [Pelotomaculum terephthalicicum JT]|uniref:IS66 family transposase n=1 Tax=Pelotomaculum terephthalicicum TaxID=206393 RepID=UPI001F03A9D5|nr:IS66 family transposase [Pelotomaculum terephthalicicum]MCG9969559.1 IS66 family transposase [Pelotomaculum terephthalicicum JT]
MDTQENSARIIEQLSDKILQQEYQIAELNAKLRWYEEQFRLSRQQKYGASSERTDHEQLNLFNEVEDTANPQVEEATLETVTYQRQKKQAGQRAKQIEALPEEVIEYRLEEHEKVCPSCQGVLHEMSTQTRQEFKIIPAQVKLVKHIQHIYACRRCERENLTTPIIKAQMPAPILPGSLASPSMLAYIADQKYTNSLPLYRQEQQFSRLGIELSRQTMANWLLAAADPWLKRIYDRMHEQLVQRDILHADETTLQVLREPGRSAESKSYMWLYRTGRDGPPIVLYDYQTTRASKHPISFLAGFKGYLQTDGYNGYGQLKDVILIGCWSHARRKFAEALKALPAEQKNKPVATSVGLDYCNQLFAIERQLKDQNISDQDRYEERLKLSMPVLDNFYVWLKKQRQQTLPKSTFGQAITYCLNQWDNLKNFLLDGRLEIDNNRAERSIKPFVIGRKNFLFSNTPRGARGSAIIYSIIETAKENNLKPFNYLTYLFEQLPNVDTGNAAVIDSLLPWSDALLADCRMPQYA